MDNFAQSAAQTSFETVKDVGEGFRDSFKEQVGVKEGSGNTENFKGQFDFWSEFLDQLRGEKSPQQMQQEALTAQQNEKGRTPQEMAVIRHRLKELNTPTQSSNNQSYEYKGPQVPTMQDNTTRHFESQGPQIPTTPQPSSLNFAKQGSNEMLKKMVG